MALVMYRMRSIIVKKRDLWKAIGRSLTAIAIESVCVVPFQEFERRIIFDVGYDARGSRVGILTDVRRVDVAVIGVVETGAS